MLIFFPRIFLQFRENYPNVFIKVWKGDSSYLQELLLEREIELSFMLLPMNVQEYHVKSFPQDPFVVVIPASWKGEFPNN